MARAKWIGSSLNSGKVKLQWIWLSLGILALGAVVFSSLAPWIFGSVDSVERQWVGKKVPSILIADNKGNPIELQKLLTPNLDSVVPTDAPQKHILALWATWCDPCVREIPVLNNELGRLASQNTWVHLISYDEGERARVIANVNAWLLTKNWRHGTAFDFDSSLVASMNISALPTAIGVNSDLSVAWIHVGEIDWSTFEWSNFL